MKELLTSSGVVQVDVLFVEPEAPYIASSGDAPSVLPLKATCIVSSICSLSSCTDRGQFSIMQPDVPTCVMVCSLTTCMVVSRQFRLVQTELMGMSDNRWFLTCDKKFLIPVVTDRNSKALSS